VWRCGEQRRDNPRWCLGQPFDTGRWSVQGCPKRPYWYLISQLLSLVPSCTSVHHIYSC
jgi:hypothetical protein